MIIKQLTPGKLVDTMHLKAGVVELFAHHDVGEHSSNGGDELLVILEGTALVRINSEMQHVRAPAAVLVPGGAVHNVTNSGSGSLRYVYVVAKR